MSLRVYIASALANALHVERLAEQVIDGGHLVCSTWHAITEAGAIDPEDEATRTCFLENNLADLACADVVLAYTARGVPRCTMVEVGYALAMSKPVVWIAGPNGEGRNLADAHPLVTRLTTTDSFVRALSEIEGKREAAE